MKRGRAIAKRHCKGKQSQLNTKYHRGHKQQHLKSRTRLSQLTHTSVITQILVTSILQSRNIGRMNRSRNKIGYVILISENTDFKLKQIRRDEERYCILIKGKVNQEDITIINIHAQNSGTLSFVKGVLLDLKTRININPLTGDF